MKSGATRHPTTNAMTVDVEDYFQVQALESVVRRNGWDAIEPRVHRSTARVLDIFGEAGQHGTFFVLGWVASRFPDLVRRIHAEGHEVASHGLEHVRVDRHTPATFRNDVRSTKRALEDIIGAPVRGYRAPSFSIGCGQFWAYDVLAEEGYAYSSSVYPVRRDNYGIPDAPRAPFKPANGRVVELTLPTIYAAGRNLPAGGGGFFRLLPYAMSRWTIERFNADDGGACIFYFHPWELDHEQPRVAGLPIKSRVRHYLNLGRMEARLRRLVHDFRWERMDRVFADVIDGRRKVESWTPRDVQMPRAA